LLKTLDERFGNKNAMFFGCTPKRGEFNDFSRKESRMRNFITLGFLVASAFLVSHPGYADTVVDLSSATFGFSAPITTQYALDGITFATETTGGVLGVGVTGGGGWTASDPIDGTVSGLANTPTGEYPTTEFLDIFFTSPASGVSFWFDNFGCSDSGRGASFYTVYGSGSTVIGGGGLCPTDEDNFNKVVVGVSGVSEIQIDNNTPDTFSGGEEGDSWEFGLSRVEFTESTTVPEPGTGALTLLAVGLAGLAAKLHRKPRA